MRGFLVLICIFGVMVMCGKSDPKPTRRVVPDSAEQNKKKAEDAMKAEFEKSSFVKGVVVEPVWVMVGVFPEEKEWGSDNMRIWACGILRRNRMAQDVRFVDVRKLSQSGQTFRSARIVEHRC